MYIIVTSYRFTQILVGLFIAEHLSSPLLDGILLAKTKGQGGRVFWQCALRLVINQTTRSTDATVLLFFEFLKSGAYSIPDFGCCRFSSHGIDALADDLDAEAARLYIGEVENLVAKVRTHLHIFILVNM